MAKKKTGLTDKEALEQMRNASKEVSEEKVEFVVSKEDKLKGFFRHVDVLKKHWKDVCDVFSLLKDWVTGEYKELPWTIIAALVGALLYVLSPLDVIPDFIPLIGYTDDAAVFAMAIGFAGDDLAKYRAWKKKRKKK